MKQKIRENQLPNISFLTKNILLYIFFSLFERKIEIEEREKENPLSLFSALIGNFIALSHLAWIMGWSKTSEVVAGLGVSSRFSFPR